MWRLISGKSALGIGLREPTLPFHKGFALFQLVIGENKMKEGTNKKGTEKRNLLLGKATAFGAVKVDEQIGVCRHYQKDHYGPKEAHTLFNGLPKNLVWMARMGIVIQI